MGWLRLGAPLRDVGDAGDAGGASDAGAASEAADTGAEAPAFIVGPLALVDLPVAIGDELVVSVAYGPRGPLYFGADRVVLEKDHRVLLFYEDGFITSPDAVAGFSHVVGAIVCEQETSCASSYRKELRVTMPDGTSATLAPGDTRTIGAYRVSHGTTVSVVRKPISCTDLLYDTTYSQVTAVLVSEE
ncbi:MAG TPA: hypothetical protein VMG12_34525 [Polyangiaceae bacterium]|nr:hypothetical protein [Polyangiaceae bacterium]